MSDIITMRRTSGAERSAMRVRAAFNARPVCAAGRESRSTEGPYSTHYTAVASYLYINRISGTDRFGTVPDDYVGRGDLVAAGRCHPQQHTPPHLRSGDTLWREADDGAEREGPRAISATHIVADLPGASPARWEWLVQDYVYRHLVAKGMIVDWAIHHRNGSDTRPAGTPHVHMLATARFWRANGRFGSRHWQWCANADQIRTIKDAWMQLIGPRATNAA